MSWWNALWNTATRGSFVADSGLALSAVGPSPAGEQQTLADWAARANEVSPQRLARELAGLDNEALTALALAHLRSPQLPRPSWLRVALGGGALLLALGAGLLLLRSALATQASGDAVGLLGGVGVSSLAAGLLALAGTALITFRTVPMESAYAQVGLMVGPINEQHRWLFEVRELMDSPSAEAYRCRTLRERGPLRGVDCLMMRELAQADANRRTIETARHVADTVQHLPAPKEPATASVLPLDATLPVRLVGATR